MSPDRTRQVYTRAIAALLLGLSGCGGGDGADTRAAVEPGSGRVDPGGAATARGGDAQGVSLGCAADLRVALPGGGTLVNNTWNKAAAGRFDWQQCLWQRAATGPSGTGTKVEHGWSWRWPNPGRAVYAYPEVVVGVSPWGSPGAGSDRRFPLRIDTVRKLHVAFDTDVKASGNYNLSLSVWLIRRPVVADPPVLSDILAELMIWADYTPDMVADPGTTTHRGEFSDSAGTAWDVWAAERWGDASGSTAHTWTHVSFLIKPTQRRPRLAIDLMEFVRRAQALGLLNGATSIADIELGTELVSGSGRLWLRSFEVGID